MAGKVGANILASTSSSFANSLPSSGANSWGFSCGMENSHMMHYPVCGLDDVSCGGGRSLKPSTFFLANPFTVSLCHTLILWPFVNFREGFVSTDSKSSLQSQVDGAVAGKQTRAPKKKNQMRHSLRRLEMAWRWKRGTCRSNGPRLESRDSEAPAQATQTDGNSRKTILSPITGGGEARLIKPPK